MDLLITESALFLPLSPALPVFISLGWFSFWVARQQNERFGTDFTQADQLFFDQIQEEAIESEMLKKAAVANSRDDFRYVFEKAFEGLVIDRMEGNEEIFGKLMADGEFRKLAVEHLLHKVYGALKKPITDFPK